MRTRRLVFPLFLAACGASDLAAQRAPIVDGMLDQGDPSVVFLWLGGGSCSGSLISPHVVLTADHCVSGASVSEVEAFFGNDSDGQGTWIKAVDFERHPSGDIAMIALETAGPTPPLPVNGTTLGQADLGKPVRLVGFGVTTDSGSDSGIKRHGMSEIEDVDGDIVYVGRTGSATCYGDSGGPTFIEIDGVEHVAAVSSFVTDACGFGLSGNTRTDTYHDWIVAYVNAIDPATCAGDGLCASGCPAPDPDCPCADDGHCTAACSDLGSDADCMGCGAGDTCRADCPEVDVDCCGDDDDCNAACGDLDPDCAPPPPPPPGGEDDGSLPGDFTGGCAATGRADLGVAWLAALAAALLGRRRRRRDR